MRSCKKKSYTNSYSVGSCKTLPLATFVFTLEKKGTKRIEVVHVHDESNANGNSNNIALIRPEISTVDDDDSWKYLIDAAAVSNYTCTNSSLPTSIQ